jgi:hypothetical protein
MSDTAQVNVLNRALYLLGQDPVADLSEGSLQGSGAATKLMRLADAAKDVVLRRHGWTCALQYVTLSPAVLAGDANWRYPTTFLLPADALRVWEVQGLAVGCDPRWQLATIEPDGGGARIVIRAASGVGGLDSLNLVYVRRAGWEALDAHVRDAVAHEIAAQGCWSVTGDQARTTALEKRAEEKALMAISVDGAQEGGQPPMGASKTAALRASSC